MVCVAVFAYSLLQSWFAWIVGVECVAVFVYRPLQSWCVWIVDVALVQATSVRLCVNLFLPEYD